MEKKVTPDVTHVIQACPLFSRLSKSSLQLMADVAIRRTFTERQQIFRQGDDCPGIFVVEKGLVRVYCDGSSGDRHVLHLCGPSQSFAEVAVFANFKLPASASSVRPTCCILIPTDRIQQLIANDHSFCRQMLGGMAYWTRHFTERLSDIVLRDASDRVSRYLASLPRRDDGQIQLPGLKKDIASHLNLTSETFSRTLRRLAEDDQIEFTSDRKIRWLKSD